MVRTAVVAGVGPGLGASLVRKFAAEGYAVGFFARSEEYLFDLETVLREEGCDALGVPTDITDREAVREGFEAVRAEFGPVNVLCNHAGGAAYRGIEDLSADAFENAWRTCALGGFSCTREALDDLLDRGGTVLFTGATSGIEGRADAVGFSAAKFAVRGMAMSLARDLGPRGVHVCHVVIDGGVRPPDREVENPDAWLDPDAIAESYWHLVEQDESTWTAELDLRPGVEEFWTVPSGTGRDEADETERDG